MEWVRLDVDFFHHPRTGVMSERAQLAYLRMLCWCGEHETGWTFPKRILRQLGISMATAEALENAGLWETADDGYRIRDAEDYQPSAEYMAELRQKRAEAGRKGGIAKANALANAKANAMALAKQMPWQNSGKPVAQSQSPSQETDIQVPLQPLPHAANGEEKQGTGSKGDEKHLELLRRLNAVCVGDNRAFVSLESAKVVDWALRVCAPTIVDEAIGWCEKRDEDKRPVLPRAVAAVIHSKAADHNIQIPEFKP